MPHPESNAVQKSREPASRAVPDRRRHPRVATTLLGRFMRSNTLEYPCKMIDISVSGAALMAPIEPEIGEKIVAYFDQVGGLEGTVVRNFPGGFAIELIVTAHKREKLAATLMFMLNKHELPGIEGRRHERLAPTTKALPLTLSEGITITCAVLDVSLSGASVITAARPALGTMVKLGNLNTRVVRHHDKGIAVEFVDVQNPNAMRRYFG